MEILQQCKKWNQNGEYQKIIDAVEAIPREERTPEMDSELQQAYSALNNQEKQELEHEIVPKIYADTGSLLSADDIAILESFNEGVTGYFGKMLQWLQDFVEAGVEEGRFTEKQAKEDLQIALWYAYACNNIDEYIYFYQAVDWMSESEKNATGCGTWYYRYSVALMYCGKLEEALQYAEKGAEEEPDYPWIWLQVGKLRAHFGDKDGALKAAKQGLQLVPDDYEFLTLQKEIAAGATLEQMLCHWINPDADKMLQQGEDEEADEKKRALACIQIDESGLLAFYDLFHPEQYEYQKNAPFCSLQYQIEGEIVELSFRMNEAGLSKMGTEWLSQLKNWLDSGKWLHYTVDGEVDGLLVAVVVEQNRYINLIYQQQEDNKYFRIALDSDGREIADSNPETYTENEMFLVEQHIQKAFGEFENVFHEIVSNDIHVDICVIAPTSERDYYTLVTMGMGAHRMNVPDELAEYKLERAELAIALPTSWKLDEESLQDERWYWPIRLLKSLARLPIYSDCWLGWGHTVDLEKNFAENTELCAAILLNPVTLEENENICRLSNGEEVNFYQVIPLYRYEMDYKVQNDTNALLEKLDSADISFVIDAKRKSAVSRRELHNNSAFLS